MEKKIKSPLQTVRAYCLYCCCGNALEVRTCDAGSDPNFASCIFHKYRMGKGRVSVKTLRKFCLECMGGSFKMVEECNLEDCLIHPYRMGKNPNKKSVIPVKALAALKNRANEARV